MTNSVPSVLTFVAGHRVVHVVTREESPRRVDVAVTMDFGRTWHFTEPGWRPLSFGVADGDRPYWWSARNVVVLPTNEVDDPLVVELDEDVILAFPVPDGWLIACETSVRMHGDKLQPLSRVELADTIVQARWKDNALRLLDAGHRLVQVTIVDGELVAADVV